MVLFIIVMEWCEDSKMDSKWCILNEINLIYWEVNNANMDIELDVLYHCWVIGYYISSILDPTWTERSNWIDGHLINGNNDGL